MRTRRLLPTVLLGALAVLACSAAPALADTAPSVTIGSPSGASATSVDIAGTVNPHGGPSATSWSFQYSKNPLEEGWSTALSGEYPEGSVQATSTSPLAVSGTIEGLQPNATYELRLVASNAGGEASPEPEVSVKTLPLAPTIVSQGASALTPFAAHLEALINPNNQTTSCVFEYGTTTSYGKSTACEPGSLEGFGEQGVGANIGGATAGTGLASGTPYFYRVVGENAAHEKSEGTGEFTTLEAKAPEFLGESALNAAEPRLEARINPQFQQTTYRFEYSSEESAGALAGTVHTIDGASTLPAVNEELTAGPVTLTGLTPGTYYYRVVAENETSVAKGEPTDGPVQEFKVIAGPIITTNLASAPTRTSATVSGSIIVQGLPSTYHFAYIPLAAYEAARAKGAANPFEGTGGRETYDTKLAHLNEEGHEVSFEDYASHPVEVTLEELAPQTTYVYALVAHNELATQVGSPQTFTTQAATPPIAITGGASVLSQSSATLAGFVDTRGLQTSVALELATTPGAGSLLPATVVPGSQSGTTEQVQGTFSGTLQPATTYYYRVIASNQDGSQAGAVLSFTTPGFPAVFPTTALPAVIPFTSIAALNAKEAKEAPSRPRAKAPTRQQMLAKALKACRRDHNRHKRSSCEHHAHARYGARGHKK